MSTPFIVLDDYRSTIYTDIAQPALVTSHQDPFR